MGVSIRKILQAMQSRHTFESDWALVCSLRDMALSPRQQKIKYAIFERPGITTGELCRQFRLTPNKIGSTTKELFDLGIIERTRDLESGRFHWYLLAWGGSRAERARGKRKGYRRTWQMSYIPNRALPRQGKRK